MKNYINSGKNMPFTATGAVTSGQGVVMGTVLGVSIGALANGEIGEAQIEGLFELPKLSTAVISQGARLIWDVSDSRFIVATPATGDLLNCAVAESAAGNGTTTVRARLCPGAGTVQA